MQRDPVGVYRRFGDMCSHHLQGESKQAIHSSYTLVSIYTAQPRNTKYVDRQLHVNIDYIV